MSFNSFQANSISISNNGNTVECYDTNMEEKNVGCSSLRVRFRMITRKNDNFKARISSSISTSSMYSNSSSNNNNNNNNNMLTNSSSLALNNPNKDIALAGSTSSLSSYTVNQNQNFLEIKQNNQSMNHAVFFYNNNQQQQQHQNLQCKRYNHPIQTNNRELIESKSIPINIGINKSNPSSASTTSTTSSTTKTFRLTEDLKSNIHFDITLKPTR